MNEIYAEKEMLTPRKRLILTLPQMETTSSPVSPEPDEAESKTGDRMSMKAMMKILKFKNVLLKKTKEAQVRHQAMRAEANRALLALKVTNKLRKKTKKRTVSQAENDYKLSGDLSFYTDENIAKREHILQHIDVQHALLMWWAVVKNRHSKDPSQPALNKIEYLEFHFALYNVFNKSAIKDDSEWRKVAEEDWDHDCKEHGAFTESRFKSSLFELADIWCETITVKDYVDFINYAMTRMCELDRENSQVNILNRDNSQIRVPSYLHGIVSSFADTIEREDSTTTESLGDRLYTGLQNMQLEDMKIEFLRAAESGNALGLAEFHSVLVERLGIHISEEEANRLFALCDVDDSKSIDFREFLVAAQVLMHNYKPETYDKSTVLQNAFDIYKVEDPGVISTGNFLTVMDMCGLGDEQYKQSGNPEAGPSPGARPVYSDRVNMTQFSQLSSSPKSILAEIRRSSLGIIFVPEQASTFKLKEPLKDPGEEDEVARAKVSHQDDSGLKIKPLSRFEKLHYGIALRGKSRSRRGLTNSEVMEELRKVQMKRMNKRMKPAVLPNVHVNEWTKWHKPGDQQLLLSNEVCAKVLERSGCSPVALSPSTMERLQRVNQTHGHIGHGKDDPNHLTCTMMSRPLRGVGKAEQAIGNSKLQKERLEELNQSSLNWITGNVVLDRAVTSPRMNTGTDSIRRPLSVSLPLKQQMEKKVVFSDEELFNLGQYLPQEGRGNTADSDGLLSSRPASPTLDLNMRDGRNNTGSQKFAYLQKPKTAALGGRNRRPMDQSASAPLLMRPSTTVGISSSESANMLLRSPPTPFAGNRFEETSDAVPSIHALPVVKFRYSKPMSKRQKKFGKPFKLPRPKSKRKQREDASHIVEEAPATPRKGVNDCNQFIVASRTLSLHESEVPEDPLVWADPIWDQDKSKVSMEIVYREQMASRSGIRPGTSGNQTLEGPVQSRGLVGTNEPAVSHSARYSNFQNDRFASGSPSTHDKLRAQFLRSNTPLHERQITAMGNLRTRRRSGQLAAMQLPGMTLALDPAKN